MPKEINEFYDIVKITDFRIETRKDLIGQQYFKSNAAGTGIGIRPLFQGPML